MIQNKKDNLDANKNANAKKANAVLLNDKIKFKTLDVIDPNGNLHPKMDRNEALKMAESHDLDLLVIAVQKDRVIAKILDYGKFKFEQSRKQKENRKNQSNPKIKEIKVKPLIGEHDLKVKVENAKKWLAQGDKVKFVIEARGRMATKSELITKIFDSFVNLLDGAGNISQANKAVNATRYETIIDPK